MATRLRGKLGAGHHAPQLHLDPEGQAGGLRASGRVRRQPSSGPPPGRDHLDPRERLRLPDLDHPGARTTCTTTTSSASPTATARSPATISATWLKAFYLELNELLDAGTKVIVHNEEVGDRLIGIMGGYIRWSGLVDDDSQAITITERIAGRQLDPFAREVILMAHTPALTLRTSRTCAALAPGSREWNVRRRGKRQRRPAACAAAGSASFERNRPQARLVDNVF